MSIHRDMYDENRKRDRNTMIGVAIVGIAILVLAMWLFCN